MINAPNISDDKRWSVGVYISKRDLDIAAWFNMLKRHGIKPVKIISAIILAERSQMEFDAGTIDQRSEQAFVSPTKDNTPSVVFGSCDRSKRIYTHGWQIKNKDGTYKLGSVIPVTFTNPEVLIAMNDLIKSAQVSTYIKALIRKYIKKASTEIPPDTNTARQIFDDYILGLNAMQEINPSKRTHKKRKPTSSENKHQTENHSAGNADLIQKPAQQHPPAQQNPPAQQPATQGKRAKNPLLETI